MKILEFLKKHTRLFFIWTICGFAAEIILMLIIKPWGAGLGVAESPQRLIFYDIGGWWLFRVPMVLWLASLVAKKEEWLAPRGKYVEGKSYPLMSTYHYVGIALCVALFVAAGAFSWQAFDLGAAAATIATVFFGPLVGFFTIWIGDVLRSFIFPSVGNPLIWLLGLAPGDAADWLAIGVVFWLLRSRMKNLSLAFILWAVFYFVYRATFSIWDYALWIYPGSSLVPTLAWWELQFMPGSTLSAVVGGLVSIGLLQAVQGRRRTNKTTPTTPTTTT